MRFWDIVAAKLEWPEDVTVIVADNIARQIDALAEDRTWPASSYGVVAPPFPAFWVEAITEATDEEGVQRQIRRGSLISVVWDREQDEETGGQLEDAGTRWVLGLDGFIQIKEEGWSEIATYNSTALLRLDHEGRIQGEEMRVQYHPHTTFNKAAAAGKIFLLPPEGVVNHVVYSMMAISAMHRRVPVEQVTPARATRRQNQRQIGREGSSYYVLMVRPAAPGRFEEVGSPAQGIKVQRREHVVRGHFKYYHPDRPLFGRPGAAGMMWFGEHERGSDEQGSITKDYKVRGDG